MGLRHNDLNKCRPEINFYFTGELRITEAELLAAKLYFSPA
jgi:hypothetical protein